MSIYVDKKAPPAVGGAFGDRNWAILALFFSVAADFIPILLILFLFL